jgi:hypothetical protein
MEAVIVSSGQWKYFKGPPTTQTTCKEYYTILCRLKELENP